MSIRGLEISLRNDSGSAIVMGTLSVAPAGSALIWDTEHYTFGATANFIQVLEGISVFNEQLQTNNLVMVINGSDVSIEDAFVQFNKLHYAFNEVLFKDEFAILRMEAESVIGLSGIATSDRAGLLSVDGYSKLENLDDVEINDHISDTNNPHNTSIANIGSGTLSELNVALSDATLDDTNASRTPTAHASTHLPNGSDPLATAAPSTIGATNSAGSANSFSRSDHIHSHGNQGGGSLHAVATTSVAGFMSGTDKIKLDGIATGATATPLSSTAPVNVTKAAAVIGVGTTAARADHKHDITTAAAVALTVGMSNAEGTSVNLSRSDHTHAIAAGTPVTIETTNAAGDSLNFSRANHVHAHGNQTSGTLHAAATTSVNGFMSSADKTKLDGVATNATATPLSSTTPVNVTKAAAVIGVGTTAARSDHKHDVATATASSLTVGGSNAEGSSTSLSRADHTHALPAFGSTAGTFTEGNDARLSDARTPLVHATTHESGGTDVIDGYQISIDYTPINYPSSNNELLGEHLANIDSVLSTAGGGDVTGPASATNNAISRFDGTTGKAIKNSSVTIDDSGNVSTPGSITTSTGLVVSGNITVTGTVDGVDVSSHASRHLPNGVDALATAEPSTIGATNAAGSANSFSRSDHIHAHGNQTSGTLHAAATTSVNGFMSSADKTKLDGVATNATATPLSSTAPVNVTKAAAVIGVDTTAARADHKHDVTTAAAVALTVGMSNAEGNSTSLSRANHTHAIAAGTPVAVGTANATGSATTFVRSDHVHAHGNQTSGTLHAAATTSVNGFMSSADKTKLDGVATGATANTGDVVGPASATNNAIARFDSTTGKLIKNSGIQITDTNILDMNNNDIREIKTAVFNSWTTINATASAATVAFANYQKATVNLNNQASVTITLNEPAGPGNFMVIIKQGGTTETTSFTWATENTHAIYAPNGDIVLASGLGAISVLGLVYDGTDWYVVSSQPMEQVIAS